ncbi:unnamed protein product [Ixodes pacificus]
MASNGGGRRVVLQIWKNFWASITSKKLPANEMGSDHLGNKYFEIPAEPSKGKRRPVRWFEPHIKDKLDQEVPVEWDAWLRCRRQDPPTQEEILRNIAIMEAKKKSAVLLKEAAQKEREERTGGAITSAESAGPTSFPQYPEYRIQAQAEEDSPKAPPPPST